MLFVACSFAEGSSNFYEIEELKHKESDRLKAMQEGLDKMKINNFLKIVFFALKAKVKITSHQILAETYYDHRIAMSFAIAG